MACPVRRFLDESVTNGDRAQFEVLLDDRTRHVEHLARSIQQLTPEPITGTDVLKHRHHTCDCNGWVD